MSGSLEIRAKFPAGEVRIRQFGGLAGRRRPRSRRSYTGGRAMVTPILLIDGEYRRQILRQAMLDFFGAEAELDRFATGGNESTLPQCC